jgi:hypothetical protein
MSDLYGDPEGQEILDCYEQRLTDNTVTPPPDAAAFRIDFPQWLSEWTERDRRIIGDMMRDERTRDLASKYGISPGRIAQRGARISTIGTAFTGRGLPRARVSRRGRLEGRQGPPVVL